MCSERVFEPVGGDATLDVRDVTKRYDSLPVIEPMNLRFDAGTIVALLGPSGCGKSTLLRILAGVDEPTTGEIRSDGQAIDGPSAERILLFQKDGLFPWRTLFGNVAYGLELAGRSEEEIAATVYPMLERVGLEAFPEYYPHQLSGGMRQRAAIARALVMEPKALLMDEPFGSLDAITRLSMHRLLLELWERSGQSVVLVTHDVDEALYLSDRVVVLSQRPAEVLDVVAVDLERPRDRSGGGYAVMREHLLGTLGVEPTAPESSGDQQVTSERVPLDSAIG